MTTPNLKTLQAETLLREAGWIRKLAISLVGDAQRAEDLAQDTWVRALESPPKADGSMRAWLATVMTNLLRQERRGRLRRVARETRVASEDRPQQESSEQVLARVNVHRDLVESVLQLDEPYRTTILLRYFEEYTPKRLAERQGVPVSTVKTRLARGLERLRERLDAEHGRDGRSWALALLPVLERPQGLAPVLPFSKLPIGALLVNSKAIAIALTLTALGAGYMLTRPAEVEADKRVDDALPGIVEGHAESNESRPNESTDTAALGDTAALASARESVEAVTPEEAATEVVSAVQSMVRGRVVDLTGKPVGGVGIIQLPQGGEVTPGSEEPKVQGTTKSDGTFRFARSAAGSLMVSDPRYATVMAGAPVQESTGKETVLVVAPKISLGGRVMDEFGTAVAGARVQLSPAADMQANLGHVLDYSSERPFETESSADGTFELPVAAAFPDGKLSATASGFLPTTQPAPLTIQHNLVLVLQSPEVSKSELTGIVLDPSGAPVPEAEVSMGIDTTFTNSKGEFRFDLADPESFNRKISRFMNDLAVDKLIAIKQGYLPGSFSAPGKDSNGQPDWPDHVVLRLGGEPLSIRGRVVDQDGGALEGISVWIENPTFFGGRHQEGRPFPRMVHVESTLSGLDQDWAFVETDAQGEFELRGLMDREYTLDAMDPNTLLRTRTTGVQAGSSRVEIIVSSREAWNEIRGRVVDGRGRPVSRASVGVNCDTFVTRIQGRTLGTNHASVQTVETDEEGRFEFQVVPKRFAYFRVDHPDTIPIELGRTEQSLREHIGEDHEDFTLVVSRRCHFQVQLDDPSEADLIEIHDAEGTALQISEFSARGRQEGTRFAISAGKSNLLAVGDSATTLVLLKEGAEVRRVAIALTPGEQNLIEP